MSLLLHVISSALNLLFIVACIGLLATALWVIPVQDETLEDDFGQMLGLILIGLTLMSAINLFQRSMEMSGLSWPAAFSAVSPVLFKTHYGLTWWVRIASIAGLWAGLWYGCFAHQRWKVYAMFLAAACLAWSVSASGHASDWGDLALPEWGAWLHIMAASCWVGGILAFVWIICPRLLQRHEQVLFILCAHRLSRLAGLALGIVLCTGLYNAWHQLGHIDDLWNNIYGRIILFKLLIVCAMIVLGAINRFVGLPALRQGELQMRRFVWRMKLEAWLALAVLLCAALLQHGMPPNRHTGTINQAISAHDSMSVHRIERGWMQSVKELRR